VGALAVKNMAESYPKCAINAQLGRQALVFGADGARSLERLVVESFTFTFHDPDSTATWNVDEARAMIARDPRPPLRVDPNWLKGWLATEETFDPGHLDHIPVSKRKEPGILIRVANIEEPGAPIKWVYILVDGSHRAALALREGRAFHAYLLSEPEQYAICTCTTAHGEVGKMPTVATANQRGWTHEEIDQRSSLHLAEDWGPLHMSSVRRAWLELTCGHAWFAFGDYEIRIPTGVLAATALFVMGLALLFIVAPR
jgi:hypothetical protein